MSKAKSISILELMQRTEQYLFERGYKKGTLGTYKATWNRFVVFSPTEFYSRTVAEDFLFHCFGVDAHSAEQKLDQRMRHALRHMNALDDYLNSGNVPRKKMRNRIGLESDKYELFFGDYLKYCKQRCLSSSWFSNTESALRLFLAALNATGVHNISEINIATIERFSELVINHSEFCQNTRRSKTKTIAAYLKWLSEHGLIDMDYGHLLPNFKRTPQMLPVVWSEMEIQNILDVIDVSNPTGKRNFAIFLLLARTGLRIGDVVTLKFSNIDWRKNAIHIIQQKTGKPISIPLSAEIGEAIISYLKHGRPSSDSEAVFLSHNAPFQPLHAHNSFHSELRKYMRRAGIDFKGKRHAGVHTIRSSFATNMLKNGADLESVSQALGHSDINVANHYLRVDVDHLRICALGLEVLK